VKELKSALVIAGSLILVAIIACLTYFNRAKADDVLTVTGMGSIDFQSDIITWQATYQSEAQNLAAAYGQLKEDKAALLDFLREKKISEADYIFQPVVINKQFRQIYNDKGNQIGETFAGYLLTQTIRVQSKGLDAVEVASREVTDLIQKGFTIQSESPQFFYSGLADLKLKLIAIASQDAKSRAEQIARNVGGKLGKVRYSNMGVIQIIGENSPVDDSWQGSYDTASRKKTATVTLKVQYELR
jgi:hypothetical protein